MITGSVHATDWAPLKDKDIDIYAKHVTDRISE